MAICKNLKLLLFTSCYLAISLHVATSRVPPPVSSPFPQPGDISPSPQGNNISLAPQPDGISPSPQGNYISLAPQSNGISPSPQANLISMPPQPDDISPSPGPSTSPMPTTSSPSPGPDASEAPYNPVVSYPLSISEPPLGAMSPYAEGPSAFNDLFNYNLSISPVSSSGVEPALKNICDATDHPDLCVVVVQPHLEGKQDILSVLDVSVKGGIALAQHVITIAKKEAENPNQDPQLGDVLRDCRNAYDKVAYNFWAALRVLPSQDIGTFNNLLNDVITDISDCEDELKLAGAKSPFGDYADKLSDLTSNCLSIISLLN